MKSIFSGGILVSYQPVMLEVHQLWLKALDLEQKATWGPLTFPFEDLSNFNSDVGSVLGLISGFFQWPSKYYVYFVS